MAPSKKILLGLLFEQFRDTVVVVRLACFSVFSLSPCASHFVILTMLGTSHLVQKKNNPAGPALPSGRVWQLSWAANTECQRAETALSPSQP